MDKIKSLMIGFFRAAVLLRVASAIIPATTQTGGSIFGRTAAAGHLPRRRSLVVSCQAHATIAGRTLHNSRSFVFPAIGHNVQRASACSHSTMIAFLADTILPEASYGAGVRSSYGSSAARVAVPLTTAKN